MTLDLPDLCESLATRIKALNSSAYDQTGYGTGWTETRVPATAIEAPSPVGHLCFGVIPIGSANREMENDRAAETVAARTGIRIVYGYHLRTGSTSQVPDERLSMRAARDIRHALLDEWDGDRVVYLVDAYSHMISPDGEWLLCTVAFDVYHDLPI